MCAGAQSVLEYEGMIPSYEITVRFDDGSSRVISEGNPPTWRTGDKVKVINGVIQSNA